VYDTLQQPFAIPRMATTPKLQKENMHAAMIVVVPAFVEAC